MLGTALLVDCGFKSNFAWRETCRASGRQRPSDGASQSVARASKAGDSVKMTCSNVGGGQGDPHSIAAGRNRRKTATAQCKQLEQEVATLSKLGIAYHRQHKAAVDACFLVTETKSRSCGCSKRLCRSWLQPQARDSSNAACRPTSGNQDLNDFLVTLGQLHFPRPQVLVTPRALTTRQQQPFLLPFVGNEARQRQRGHGSLELWCSWLCS